MLVNSINLKKEYRLLIFLTEGQFTKYQSVRSDLLGIFLVCFVWKDAISVIADIQDGQQTGSSSRLTQM